MIQAIYTKSGSCHRHVALEIMIGLFVQRFTHPALMAMLSHSQAFPELAHPLQERDHRIHTSELLFTYSICQLEQV